MMELEEGSGTEESDVELLKTSDVEGDTRYVNAANFSFNRYAKERMIVQP